MKILRTVLFAGANLLCSTLLIPALLHAASDISARYVQSGGKQLVIEITAGANPPASVILIQKFPPGVTMLSSQPGASNYNANKNMAKWLLRDMRPGKTTVRVSLDQPVSEAEISAEIRFKPLPGGGMTTLSVGK